VNNLSEVLEIINQDSCKRDEERGREIEKERESERDNYRNLSMSFPKSRKERKYKCEKVELKHKK
jgi:hypothetical protein